MRKFWDTSLAGRIILILCSSTTLFWLLSETGSLYYHYKNTEHIILSHLTRLTDVQARIAHTHYLGAAQDAKNLLNRWNDFQRLNHASEPQRLLITSRFLPFNNSTLNNKTVEQSLRAMETMGVSDVHDYIDSFVLLPKQGVVFYQPFSMSKSYAEKRLKELVELQKGPIHHGLRWGTPVYDEKYGWTMSVAAVQLATGVMAGFNLSLKNIMLIGSNEINHVTTMLWQGPDSKLLPLTNPALSDPINTILPQLPRCQRLVTATIADYLIICRPLESTPWKVLLFYPSKQLREEALAPLYYRIISTVVALLFLIVTLYLILRNLLARPLSHFVEIIDKVTPSNLERRLPENRKDELGRIAQAYNSLLSTIAAHYSTLERKVQERTQELDEARHLAEQANQRKSDHITNISHEIRTPLNGIVGALSMLQQNPLSQDQHDLVYTALQASDYLLGIINNLLDFSRIEAGQMELSIKQTELLSLLDQAMLTVNIKAAEKKLALYSLVMADVPQHLMLDELRVRQILVNLLGNAIKFTDKGHVKLEAKLCGTLLEFTVADTGPGIPIEQQRQIFLPFSQVRQHENGSGLGLAIATRLADLMSGEIRLESHVNWGSRFSFFLPIPSPPPSSPPLFQGETVTAPLTLHAQLNIWGITPSIGSNTVLDPPELQYLPGRLWQRLSTLLGRNPPKADTHSIQLSPWSLSILVVDDVQTNRDILGKMLHQQGHQVMVANGGLEALSLGKKHIFDLVLMDVRMPDIDGLETTRRWRNPEFGILDLDCSIIALTANALPAERDRVCNAGMNDYLAKPVTLQQLAAAIDVATQWQLQRGIELMPNAMLQTPLLNLSDESIRQQLLSTLSQLHSTLQTAYHTQEREALLEVLHSLKGAAGQGGLHLVQEAAEQLEHQVLKDDWPNDQQIQQLATLIQRS